MNVTAKDAIMPGTWMNAFGDLFVSRRCGRKEMKMLRALFHVCQHDADKNWQTISVDVDQRVDDVARLYTFPPPDGHGSLGYVWQGPFAPGRPPIGSRGRVVGIDAKTRRLIGPASMKEVEIQ